MKNFINLFENLENSNKTNDKINAIIDFLSQNNDKNNSLMIALLIGLKVKKKIKQKSIRETAIEQANIPVWLFEECYERVGDLAETLSLVLPINHNKADYDLAYWIEEIIPNLNIDDEQIQKETLLYAWSNLDKSGKFLFNKIVMGGFRIGVSKKTIINAISLHTGIEEQILQHRLMGIDKIEDVSYIQLKQKDTAIFDISKPYPFYLASPLEGEPKDLGDSNEWIIEWKWDGIRAQCIKRNNEIFVWSRGEELINDSFPDVVDAINNLPNGIVLDCEIVPWNIDRPSDFGVLQKRLGRKKVSKKLTEELPVKIVCYDLLEFNYNDIRQKSIEERKNLLNDLILDTDKLMISETLQACNWLEYKAIREQSREKGVEGFMLKRKGSEYKSGRVKGDWYKWKVEPYTIDAVLIYAQAGHGRRASLYTDYTFAVKNGDEFLPFAKAYSGLKDDEFRQVDRFIKTNTIEKFGPVRSVKTELVFEIAFESIRKSPRHKSGIAVRFPRISRWRKDKTVEDIDTLDTLKSMINE